MQQHSCIYSTTRILVLDPAQRAWSCTSVAVGADAVLVRTSGNSVRCHTSNRTVVVVVVVSVVFARHKPLIFTTKACARAVFTSLIRSSCCCNILQFTGSPPHINATHIRHHRTTVGHKSAPATNAPAPYTKAHSPIRIQSAFARDRDRFSAEVLFFLSRFGARRLRAVAHWIIREF